MFITHRNDYIPKIGYKHPNILIKIDEVGGGVIFAPLSNIFFNIPTNNNYIPF